MTSNVFTTFSHYRATSAPRNYNRHALRLALARRVAAGTVPIDEDFAPVPMISFYPSGETSGAIITIQNTKLTYKIAVKTNGEIAKIKE